MNFGISKRAQQLTSSAIREILKVTEDPSVISFAGGIPAPQTFPVEVMHAACEKIFADAPRATFQYAPTEGYMPLREWLAARHGVSADCVLITTGSQQALDLIGKVFIDPGSPVVVENPTYLGALQAFSMFEPSYVVAPCDDAGLNPQAFTAPMTRQARFIYTMPNFQNPTGLRMSLARRETLVKKMDAANVLIIEDDPYGELSYGGNHLPTMLSMRPENVIYMGSFSKILSPGLRIGYVIAPKELMHKLGQAKQATDLHTPSFTQRIAYEAIKTGFLDSHIQSIRTLYGSKCQSMLKALADFMPTGTHWSKPEGGMFIWARLPDQVDSSRLLATCLASAEGPRVAFVPGAPFFAGNPDVSTLRLSFVTMEPERIAAGVKQLSAMLQYCLAQAR